MPTWSGILTELSSYPLERKLYAFDEVRRKYLVLAKELTGRDTILYATKWTQSGASQIPAESLYIADEDLQGIMEVIHGLEGPNLDLILHSPGGSPVATEAIVSYLRSKFSNIRVIVPQIAMSAATMLACCADKIVMGKHSFLGPIDPQLLIQTQLGPQMAPAQAILEQFDQAKDECKDPEKMAAWMPMLGQYGPHLLVACKNASEMSREVVEEWLSKFMFKEDEDRVAKAQDIAKWLADHKEFKSHGRHIARDLAESKGLKIEYLEDDQNVQDIFLSIFHATTHTFDGTAAVKIIENHMGKAFIKQIQAVPITSSPSR